MDVVITAEICVNRTPTGIQEHQTCFGYNLGAAYRLLKGVDCNERCTYAALATVLAVVFQNLDQHLFL
jgi:hypothetical protein